MKAIIFLLLSSTLSLFGAANWTFPDGTQTSVATNIVGNGANITNVPVSALTNAGTAAYSNATAFALTQNGTIHTNGMSIAATFSNTVTFKDAANASASITNGVFQGVGTFTSVTNAAGTASRLVFYDANKQLGAAAASGSVPVDADGSATTMAQLNTLGNGTILTNGMSAAITLSNTVTFKDAANASASVTNGVFQGVVTATSLTNAAGTASRLALYDANKQIGAAAASGAVPVDADGSATTIGQLNTLGNGTILTNGQSSAITVSNTWTFKDAANASASVTNGVFQGIGTFSSLTNAAGSASVLAVYDANKKLVASAASGAVPANADGSATTSAQVNTLFPGIIVTNGESQAITFSNTVSIIDGANAKIVISNAVIGTVKAITNSGNIQQNTLTANSGTFTNFIVVSTNFTAANMAAQQGFIFLICSNNALYAVSKTKTNLVSAP